MKYGYQTVGQKWRWVKWGYALIIPVLMLFIVFGEGGLIHNYVLGLKLEKISEAIEQVESDNRRLEREIRNTRINHEYAQIMRARHALVAPKGAVIFRFSDDSRFMSIGQTLHDIDEENTKSLIFASFFGETWSD